MTVVPKPAQEDSISIAFAFEGDTTQSSGLTGFIPNRNFLEYRAVLYIEIDNLDGEITESNLLDKFSIVAATQNNSIVNGIGSSNILIPAI